MAFRIRIVLSVAGGVSNNELTRRVTTILEQRPKAITWAGSPHCQETARELLRRLAAGESVSALAP